MQDPKCRIQKILSAHGVASRRDAEKLILAGRVSVNGIPAKLGQSAELGCDEITVDGVPLSVRDKPVYIMLNKPRGVLTTVKDDRGRPTVMELVKDAGVRVYPVGRLDMETEGLLIMTNDGNFANTVAHPSYNKIKTYEVNVRGNAREAAESLRQPVGIDGHTVSAVQVDLLSLTGNGGTLIISIIEGRNRQIRKMCSACGVRVLKLRRVSVGPLKLGSLESGKWRFLTGEEVGSLG